MKMTTPGETIAAAAALILACFVPPDARAMNLGSGPAEARCAGIVFQYDTGDFTGVEIENREKSTAGEIGDGVDEGVAPEHFCFRLQDSRPLPALEQGPRYFLPVDSFVCAIPLEDPSVIDFAASYPGLQSAAAALETILRERPARFEDRSAVPDLPPRNAGPSIFCRYQYLEFASGSGLLFLAQYSQEMEPNPANNEELALDFQGLTKDGRYYVAARLAITHPSLPGGIDFTDQIDRDGQQRYLRKAETELERWPEESFRPSITRLKALLSSIHVGQDNDAAARPCGPGVAKKSGAATDPDRRADGIEE